MLIDSSYSLFTAQKELGGKGFRLYEMEKAGLPVPSWKGCPQSFFKKELQESNLFSILEDAFKNKNFKEISEQADDLFLKAPFSKDFHHLCDTLIAFFKDQFLAVRSSAADEDSITHSFAGQMSTFLFVQNRSELEKAIRLCWASAFSERILIYRQENNLLHLEKIAVAVIIQKMIPSDISGVLFGMDPISQNHEHIVINSVYGVGEGLVSGALDADTYILKKSSFEIKEERLTVKEKKFIQKEQGGIQEVDVELHLQKKSSLSHEHLQKLHQMNEKLENMYHFPQDIEWAIYQDHLYLLQTRPITTLKNFSIGKPQLWDNGNIIESYGGLTLPLTFSFAHYAYSCVYVQICEVLHVSPQMKEYLEPYLRNMIGIHKGRVYYNLLNWYRLMQIFPQSKSTQEFFETIMAVSDELNQELEDVQKIPFLHTWRARWGKVQTLISVIYTHLFAPQMVKNFLHYFNEKYTSYKKINFDYLPPEEAIRIYREMDREFLQKWKAPILNDMLAMIHFGFLRKLAKLWLQEKADALTNDLMRGEKDMESALPTQELIRLAWEISSHPELIQTFQETKPEHMEIILRKGSYFSIIEKIDSYIKRFGHRSMNELKLEQTDLSQDPTFLYVMIKNYLKNLPPQPEESIKHEESVRKKAEIEVKKILKGWKQLFFFWALKHARRAVKNRENLRFTRTRVFGIIRHLFTGVGHSFERLNLIETYKDIFYLTTQEIESAIEGHLCDPDLKSTIQKRKSSYQEWEKEELPSRFITFGPPLTYVPPPEDLSYSSEKGDLIGQGACPGCVEGIVKIILSPTDNLDLNGEILVTLRTDPGWIPLYPSISGLLVERGGLLSHSAIVAREMGIPTIVSIPHLTQKLQNGMLIRMDGKTGQITILKS